MLSLSLTYSPSLSFYSLPRGCNINTNSPRLGCKREAWRTNGGTSAPRYEREGGGTLLSSLSEEGRRGKWGGTSLGEGRPSPRGAERRTVERRGGSSLENLRQRMDRKGRRCWCLSSSTRYRRHHRSLSVCSLSRRAAIRPPAESNVSNGNGSSAIVSRSLRRRALPSPRGT